MNPDIDYLHSAFEPGGSGSITYRLCDNLGKGVPSEWGAGVERWDTDLGPNFSFIQVTSCSTMANGSSLLRWGYECFPGIIACWRTFLDSTLYVEHGTHRDIRLGLIVFNPDKWDEVPTWRSYIAVHEFGHDLSLADHISHDCAAGTVMLNYTAGYFPPEPCSADPTYADLSTVKCDVYSSLPHPPWIVPIGDTDCDGFPDSVPGTPLLRAGEMVVGTLVMSRCAANSGSDNESPPDAWPVDFNDNQLVNLGDILKYNYVLGRTVNSPPVNVPGMGLTEMRRFDLNGIGPVNVGDVLIFNAFFGKRCNV
jgi:hypothetical protein